MVGGIFAAQGSFAFCVALSRLRVVHPYACDRPLPPPMAPQAKKILPAPRI
jgi:hypothetical protein